MLGRLAVGVRLWRAARLVWPLLRDRRVPLAVKTVPFIGLLYLFFPLDLLPDFLPALGQMDDLSVLLLTLLLFVRLCPPEVVRQQAELATERRRKPGQGAGSGPIIDGEYEILE